MFDNVRDPKIWFYCMGNSSFKPFRPDFAYTGVLNYARPWAVFGLVFTHPPHLVVNFSSRTPVPALARQLSSRAASAINVKVGANGLIYFPYSFDLIRRKRRTEGTPKGKRFGRSQG